MPGKSICAITVGRIYYDEKIQFHDLAYTAAPAIMFTVPEPSLGIVAGSVPVMVPLFARFSSNIKSTISSRYSSSKFSNTKATRSSTRKGSLPIADIRDGDGLGIIGASEERLYPMSSVVVSRCSGDDSSFEGMHPEQLRATEDMVRGLGEGRRGITVLREVHVKREPRSQFEW
jgi:hypothetical protein